MPTERVRVTVRVRPFTHNEKQREKEKEKEKGRERNKGNQIPLVYINPEKSTVTVRRKQACFTLNPNFKFMVK